MTGLAGCLQDERRIRALVLPPELEQLVCEQAAPLDELVRCERRRMERSEREDTVAAAVRAEEAVRRSLTVRE
jgi:hypothetical protein